MNSHQSLDPVQCYAAIQAHDARFDGVFFVGVSTTSIYCRPVCRVRLPRADRCHFFPSAAGAEQAGFRPCLKCRPELAPGSAQVDAIQRVARQAAERIRAGALNEGSVAALAAEFELSARQLHRVVESEYGVSPVALAQTFRLLLAKQLLTDTRLKIVDIAFASGFSSLRRFNDSFRKYYRMAPSALRKKRPASSQEGVVLQLGYRPPLAWRALTEFLCGRGHSRIEQVIDGCYWRTVQFGNVAGWIAAQPDSRRPTVRVSVSENLMPHLPRLQMTLRQLFDLDADPQTIGEHLRNDPLLARLIMETPGLRVSGAVDAFELTLRAILGQQITVKAASTVFGRFVDAFGEPLETPIVSLDRTAPRAQAVAAADLQSLIDLGLTQRRARTIQCVAQAFAAGELDFSRPDRQAVVDQLLALPGIGPWTAQYVAMRALRDPNAFPHSDLGLLNALGTTKPMETLRRAELWQPWRSYAAMHLWHSLNQGG